MKAFASLPVSVLSLFFTLLLAPWTIATSQQQILIIVSVPDCIDTVSTFFLAYFDIQQPQAGTQWLNGAANPVQWKKGLLDDVPYFDIEIGRLSVDGILLVATNGLSELIRSTVSPPPTDTAGTFLSILPALQSLQRSLP